MQSIKIKGRLSYPALDKMTKMTLGDSSVMEYFGADIIIPKTDKEQIARFTEVLRKAAKDSYPNMNPDRFIEQAKSNKRAIIKDGDEKIASATKPETYEKAYTNSWYISAKNKLVQPLLVDRQAQIVSNPRDVFYAGCWVIAKLNISTYELETFKTKGFSCTLTGVQFFKNDERWGASPKANSSEFDDYGEEEDGDSSVSSFASAEMEPDALPWK